MSYLLIGNGLNIANNNSFIDNNIMKIKYILRKEGIIW